MDDGYLTWDRIRAAYPEQWVMIRRPNDQRWGHEPLGGWVLAHSPNQAEIDRLMDEAPKDPTIVSVHTGEGINDLPDFVATMDYITWREAAGFAGYLYDNAPIDLNPLPPPPPRRWWQLWR